MKTKATLQAVVGFGPHGAEIYFFESIRLLGDAFHWSMVEVLSVFLDKITHRIILLDSNLSA